MSTKKTPFLPKLVITDIDGVWTDGGMYYDQKGNEWKKFNTSDSAGVLFLNLLNIPFAIITGEDTEIVKRRAEKLKVKHLYMGIKDKVSIAKKLCKDLDIKMEDVAYIGDDINDILLLRLVGISASPSNASNYIKENVDFVTELKGGKGAFREFIETILKENNLLEKAVDMFLAKKLNLNQ